MTKLVLHGNIYSPPVRACLLTLRALEVPFEYKNVDLLAGEHKSEEFQKMNPQHTIPVLDDDGTFLWDSHAICSYLVDKYGKSDSLYPKDLVKRAQVEQRLYFDASILYKSVWNISVPFFLKKITQVPQEKIDNIRDGYDHLEKFLGDNLYLAGNTLTIADFCCAPTVSAMQAILDIDPVKYPKMFAWFGRLNKLSYYEESNTVGADLYAGILRNVFTIV